MSTQIVVDQRRTKRFRYRIGLWSFVGVIMCVSSYFCIIDIVAGGIALSVSNVVYPYQHSPDHVPFEETKQRADLTRLVHRELFIRSISPLTSNTCHTTVGTCQHIDAVLGDRYVTRWKNFRALFCMAFVVTAVAIGGLQLLSIWYQWEMKQVRDKKLAMKN